MAKRIAKGRTPAPVDYILAQRYYLETVWPYIQGRALCGVEMVIADYAWGRYHRAEVDKNITERGPQSADHTTPHVLTQSNAASVETLATIAAALARPSRGVSSAEAVRRAQELVDAASDFRSTLPTGPEWERALDAQFEGVTLTEILKSNRMPSRLPLLPALKARKKGIDKPPTGSPMSRQALLKTLRKYLSPADYQDAVNTGRITPTTLETVRWQRYLDSVQPKAKGPRKNKAKCKPRR